MTVGDQRIPPPDGAVSLTQTYAKGVFYKLFLGFSVLICFH